MESESQSTDSGIKARKKQTIAQCIFVAVIAVFLTVLLMSEKQKKIAVHTSLDGNAVTNDNRTVTTPSGLKYLDIKIGNGATAAKGDYVSVHYTGWFTNGTKFDSSKDRSTPFKFPLGHEKVIKGWDEGVLGMEIGEIRRLTIPSELGYGARGAGGRIPPNATLIFKIELVAVK